MGEGIKIGWEGGLLGGFSQMGGTSKISAGGSGLPPFFPVGKPIYIYIYIYTIVPACVLITPQQITTLANHNPAIFSDPQGTEKLNKLPQADKKP